VAGGTCVGYPTPQDVGTVTITASATPPSARAAGTPGSRSVSYQPAIDVVLRYPPRRRGRHQNWSAGQGWALQHPVDRHRALAFAGPVPLETGSRRR